MQISKENNDSCMLNLLWKPSRVTKRKSKCEFPVNPDALMFFPICSCDARRKIIFRQTESICRFKKKTPLSLFSMWLSICVIFTPDTLRYISWIRNLPGGVFHLRNPAKCSILMDPDILAVGKLFLDYLPGSVICVHSQFIFSLYISLKQQSNIN